MKNLVTVGLYRHFKGDYYFVKELVRDCGNNDVFVTYFNVCHPEFGSFVRPLFDFVAKFEEDGRSIHDRPDNKTGQYQRFERITDINYQLGSVSTEQLIEELRNRSDSPIHELDIQGLRSKVFSKDYCVGEAFEATEDTPKGVYTVSCFDTEEDAYKYLSTHSHKRNTKVFKRTFIEV